MTLECQIPLNIRHYIAYAIQARLASAPEQYGDPLSRMPLAILMQLAQALRAKLLIRLEPMSRP
jgi:hypothetical protein